MSLTWTKSSRCESGNCVEVTTTLDGLSVLVRDSKNPALTLTLSLWNWRGLLVNVRAGNLPWFAVRNSLAEVVVSAPSDPGRSRLRFDAADWESFAQGVVAGDFDLGLVTT